MWPRVASTCSMTSWRCGVTRLPRACKRSARESSFCTSSRSLAVIIARQAIAGVGHFAPCAVGRRVPATWGPGGSPAARPATRPRGLLLSGELGGQLQVEDVGQAHALAADVERLVVAAQHERALVAARGQPLLHL